MSQPSRISRVRALVGAAVLVGGLATLAGCGDSDMGTVTKASDKATVGTDKGEVRTDPDLPDGFPADEVPLVDEKVLKGAKGQPGGQPAWSVVMQSSRAIDDLSAEVKKDFADAGYTPGRGSEMGDVDILKFTNEKYDVGVTIARTGRNVTISYTVNNR